MRPIYCNPLLWILGVSPQHVPLPVLLVLEAAPPHACPCGGLGARGATLKHVRRRLQALLRIAPSQMPDQTPAHPPAMPPTNPHKNFATSPQTAHPPIARLTPFSQKIAPYRKRLEVSIPQITCP